MPLSPKEELELLELEEAEYQASLQQPSVNRSNMKFTPDAEAITPGQALRSGIAQGLTLNYGEELGLQDPQILKRAQEQAPESVEAGRLVGGLVPATAVGLATGGAALPTIVAGAALGATEASGRAEAGKRGEAALLGGALGAAAGALPAVGTVVKGAGSRLKDFAIDLTGSLSGMTSKRIKDIGIERTRKIMGALYDSDITASPALANGLRKKIEDEASRVGNKISTYYAEFDRQAPQEALLNSNELKEIVLQRFGREQSLESGEDAIARNQLQRFLDKFPADRDLKLSEVWKLIQKMDDKSRQFTKSLTEGTRAKVIADTANDIRALLHNRLEGINPQAANELREVSALYSGLLEAENGLVDIVSKTRGRGGISRINLDTAFNNTLGSTPVRQATRSAIGGVGKLLANPTKLGRYAGVLQNANTRGPQSLAATHFVLSQQDPEYQKKMEEGMKDE